MKISDLHNFVTVAQAKSFSRAAESLYRTQPAISASIKKLEREIGQTLFERGAARPLHLSVSGRVLYDYATRLLAMHDAAYSAISRLPNEPPIVGEVGEGTASVTEVVRAAMRSPIYDLARETPLDRATHLSTRLGRDVLLKREDLQPGFSFKIRGAYHRMINLTSEERSRGVVTASAGNHAQGVALSARHLGVPALIVMPTATPRIKVDAVRLIGAEIELVGDGFDQALEQAQVFCANRGATFIHAFDDLDVIAGQATVGVEIARQSADDLETVYVPVGGGGLVAGVGAALKHLRPGVRIVAVEPEGADGFARSMEAGRRVRLERVDTFADGVAVRDIGRHTFAIGRSVVDEVVRVTNDQICAAMREVFEECRLLVEPSGALSLAGLIKHAARSPSKGGAVAILSGANLDFEGLSYVVEQSTATRRRVAGDR